MPKTLLGQIIAWMLFLSMCANSFAAQTKESRLSPGISGSIFSFGKDLQNSLPQESQNTVISPLSIHLALDMVNMGAAGKNRTAISNTLRIPASANPQSVKEEAKGLISSLSSNSDVTLNIANSIWISKSLKVKDPFIKDCKHYFDAEVKNGITAKDVNDWVAKKTNYKITGIINELMAKNSDMIIVNAVYFKGSWIKEFDQKKTTTEDFQTKPDSIKVPTMHLKDNFSYYENKNFQAVKLPYKGGKMSMYVFLPAKKSSLKKFISSFSAKQWNDVCKNSRFQQVEISLPKFKTEYGVTLKSTLSAMGMKRVFNPGADFSLISSGVFISQVIHKTFIDVNETGTEAAAATAVTMPRSAMPVRDVKKFKVDRPFFFIIADEQTHTPIFIGSIVNPAK